MNNIESRAGAKMPEKEKQILRALFQKQRDAQLRPATPAQTGRFLARLRQQKLRHAAFQWTRWALAASVFLVLGGLLKPFVLPEADREAFSVMRGGDKTQRLSANDVAGKADRIQRLLESRGIVVRRLDGEGLVHLQAGIASADAPLREQLQQEGISVPAHGRLDLIIHESRPRL